MRSTLSRADLLALPGVSRRPNGLWQIRRQIAGARRQETTMDPESVKTIWDRMYADDWRPNQLDRRTTVSQWRRTFTRESALAPNTIRNLDSMARAHLDGTALGAMPLVRVHHRDVQRFLDGLTNRITGEPLAPGSVGAVRNLLGAMFASAVRAGYIPANPADRRVTIPANRPAERPTLDRIETDLVLDHVITSGNRYAGLYFLLLGRGLRLAEGIGLRREDVDLDGRVVHIQGQLDYYARGGAAWTDRTKTPKSRRDVPIGARAALALDAWFTAQGAESASIRRRRREWHNAQDLAFTGYRGYPVNVNVLRADLAAVLEESGAADHRRERLGDPDAALPGIHDLRHSFATLYASEHRGSADVKILSTLLGHSNVGITLDRYFHPDTSSADVAARLAAAVGD